MGTLNVGNPQPSPAVASVGSGCVHRPQAHFVPAGSTPSSALAVYNQSQRQFRARNGGGLGVCASPFWQLLRPAGQRTSLRLPVP